MLDVTAGGEWGIGERLPLQRLGSRASRRPRLNFALDHAMDTLRPSIDQARQLEVRKSRKLDVFTVAPLTVVASGPTAGKLENECSGGIDIVGIETTQMR